MDPLDLRAYLDVLARRWRVVTVVTLVSVIVALGLSLEQEKQYVATATVLVSQGQSESVIMDNATAYLQAVNAVRSLNNEVEALGSGSTREAVAVEYPGLLNPDDVVVRVASPNADVVSVSMQASDPLAAAELVTTYIDVAISIRRQQRVDDLATAGREIQTEVDDLRVRIATIRQPLTDVEAALAADPTSSELEARRERLAQSLDPQLSPLETQLRLYQQQLDSLRVNAGIVQSGGSTVLTAAKVPTDPISPKPIQNGILALVVGLLLGVVFAFVRDNLDERLRGTEDLQRAAPGVPPIAIVPETRSQDVGFIALRDDGFSPTAEAFRSLRTSLKFAGLDDPLRVIQVTSALAGEGKTTVVANLAEAFAQGGERVAIACCDLRRPRIHESYGQDLTPGFTDVLLQEQPIDALRLRRVSERVFLLPAGSTPPNPSELLSSERAASVIQALADQFDVVLIDSPPVLAVTDALVVSRLADATILVVDAHTTKRKVLRQALDRLLQVSAPVTGIVLNRAVSESFRYAYEY